MSDSPVASSDNRTFTVTPNSILANPVTYKIRVTTGVMDSSNHSLSSQYESSVGFRTLGSFVAVGGGGSIWSSTDTESWTSRTSGTSNTLNGVTYGNGTFVAVGNSGTILTSQDGITWDNRTSGSTTYIWGVTFGNNTFVAVGDGGVILTSSDNGTSWDNRTSGTTRSLKGITFGNDRFVAVGGGTSGNTIKGIITSSIDNGISWGGGCSTWDNTFLGVSYGNNIFAVVGTDEDSEAEYYTSNGSGCTWQTESSRKIERWLDEVAFGNNKFVSVGGNTMVYSSEGRYWYGNTNNLNTNSLNVYLNTITFGNGTFLAMGIAGRVVTTSNGSSWTTRTVSDLSNVSFNGINYAE